MPLRFRLYRWFKEGWIGAARLLVFSLLSGALGGALGLWLDLTFGDIEFRWGITSFFVFVCGCSAVCLFLSAVEALGLGYGERHARQRT